MNGQVTSSPHLHSGESVRSIMLDVIFALVPAGICGIFFFGIRALMVMLVSIATCVLCELLWQWLCKKPITISDMSAVVTGLLLAYNILIIILFKKEGRYYDIQRIIYQRIITLRPGQRWP